MGTYIFLRIQQIIKKSAPLVLLLALLTGLLAGNLPLVSAATPTYVQGKALAINSGTTINLTFSSATTNGNLIVAYVMWDNPGSVQSITDNKGNTYISAQAATRWDSNREAAQVFYAKNIAGGATTTVTVNYTNNINSWGILYLHEYTGIDKVSPLDGSTSASGTSSAMNSGSITTTNANDLIFGAGASSNRVTQAGTGFTTRLTNYANRTQDKKVTTAGSYNSTGSQNGNAWVMQVVAFKADSGTPPPPDTTAPSVNITSPANGATVSGTTTVSATATDNVAVSSVEFFVDGLSTNLDLTSPYSFSLNTTALSDGTHTLTAKASDTANPANTAVSAAVTITVNNAPDTTPPSVPTGLVATPVSSAQINLSWNASPESDTAGYRVFRDGVSVGTAASTTFADTGLSASTTYSYTVAAYDAVPNQSAQSASIDATTLGDTTPPMLSNGAPASTQPAGTTSATLSLTTNEPATCHYDTTAGTAYATMANTFATTGSTSHSTTVNGLADGQSYSFYVRCQDVAGNPNAIDYTIGFAVALPSSGTTAWPLKASANGRYLTDQNGAPYLMIGDSPQGLITHLSPDQADNYFDKAVQNGTNTVWVNLLARTDTGGNIYGNTFDGLAPFNTFNDLSTANDQYFDRVVEIVNRARNHNITVLLDPIETIDHLTVLRSNDTVKIRSYGNYLGTKFRNSPNIIWMYGNDYNANPSDNTLLFTLEAAIQETDLPGRLHTIEMYHAVYDDAAWVPKVNMDLTYTYGPAYDLVLKQYNLATQPGGTASMPIAMIESHYDFEELAGNPHQPDLSYRKQELWTLFSGGSGYVYGNYYTVKFYSGWDTHMATPAASQLHGIKDLFNSVAWYNLVPDQNKSFLTAGNGSDSGVFLTDDHAAAAVTADGSLGVVYMPSTRPITINLTKMNGSTSARWFDVTTNTYTNAGTFANTGSQQFTPPPGNHADGTNDWVLVLQAVPPTPDTAPPSAPASLTAVAQSSSQISLNWPASSDTGGSGLKGYRVFRSVDGTNFTQIASPAATSFNDTGLAASTTYYYQVQAEDIAGNLSAQSPVAQATTLTPPPPDTDPPVISAVSASNVSGSTATVTWTTSEIADSKVEYGTTLAYGSATPLDNTLVTSHSLGLSGLAINTTYHYRVISKDATGNVATSGDFTFTTTAVTTPQFMQSASSFNDGSANTISQTLTSNVTAGNALVVAVSWDSGGGALTPTCSDNRGNVYTLATNANDATNRQSLAVCYAANVTGGLTTVTVTFNASASYRRIAVNEYSGIAATNSVDIVKTNIANGTNALNNITSTAGVTTSSGDLIFGVVMDDTDSNSSIAAGTGFTKRNTTNLQLVTEDVVQDVSGSLAATFTFGTAHRYLAQMVAFRPAGL